VLATRSAFKGFQEMCDVLPQYVKTDYLSSSLEIRMVILYTEGAESFSAGFYELFY